MNEAKVAVVTGSNKGIGKAIAEHLAREGYILVVNYRRDAASAQDTLNLLCETSPRSILAQADVSTPEGARQSSDDWTFW